MRIKDICCSRTIPVLLIFFIPFLLYSVTLTFGFVYDDTVQVIGNPWIKHLTYIPEIFRSSSMSFIKGKQANTYRPLVYIVYIAEYIVFGLKPWGWHLVNMILHSLNSVMVFIIVSFFIVSKETVPLKRGFLKDGLALCAALVFALHPINSEVVSWVAGVPELIYTFLLLTSFYLYISADRGGKGKSALGYAVSVFCFILALLTKETAIVFVLLIPAYEAAKHGPAAIRRWRPYLPYLITAALYMALRSSIIGGVVHHKVVDLSTREMMLNVFPFLARYFARLILPTGLSVIYPIPPVHSITEPAAILGIITVFLFLCALLIFRRTKAVLFSLLWVLIPLLPAMYVPAISRSSMADRYLYLSTIGFAVIVAYFVRFVFKRARQGGYLRPATAVLTAAVLVLYSVGTVARSLAWKDDLTLWTAAVEKYPESPILRFNLAVTLRKLGEIDGAIRQYKEVIRANPGMEKAHYNLAVLYQEQGNRAGAIRQYKEVIRANPGMEAAHYNLAVLYQEQGDHASAIRRFKDVVRINPRNFMAYFLLALSYQSVGDVQGVVSAYKEAIRIKPGDEDAHYNLAWTYQSMGDVGNAITHYKTVIRLSPGSKDAHDNLGRIYARMGRFEEAADEFREVLRIDPSYTEDRLQLARVMRLQSTQKKPSKSLLPQ